MTRSIANRVTKLEAAHGSRHPTGRVFRSIVREGFEVADEAAFFAARDEQPGPADLIVRRVIVTARHPIPAEAR